MTALSIQVPDELATDSLIIAKQMHISRSQFIRLAIENEIKMYKKKKEQEKMLLGFQSIKKNPTYLKEMQEVMKLDNMPEDEGEAWWTK